MLSTIKDTRRLYPLAGLEFGDGRRKTECRPLRRCADGAGGRLSAQEGGKEGDGGKGDGRAPFIRN